MTIFFILYLVIGVLFYTINVLVYNLNRTATTNNLLVSTYECGFEAITNQSRVEHYICGFAVPPYLCSVRSRDCLSTTSPYQFHLYRCTRCGPIGTSDESTMFGLRVRVKTRCL